MANTKVTGDLIASSTIATGNIADNAVTSDKISGITTAHITEGSNLYYTNARADARITAATTSDLTEGTNLYYTDARADARAALLVDSAPSTLNTLNELAAALGDDPNFATTVTNSIATKLPLAGGTMTGNVLMGNTVTNPASGFANQTGIGLKYSTTVPTIEVSSDSSAMQLGRSSTGGEGQILGLRKAGTIIHNFDTNNVSIGTNATFAGNVTITGGTTSGLNITTSGTQDTININRAANNDNAITKYQTASADKWIVGLRNTGDDNFRFYSYGTSTDVLTINQGNGSATFAGMIMVNGDGIDIDNNDNLRLRFDNASTFKAGLQVATSTGDMITSSVTNDFAIRSQSNMLFATGGSTESMRIDSSGDTHLQGNLFFEGSTSYVAGYSIRRQGANFLFTGGTTGTFFNRNGNGATDMYINASGDVGIGTTTQDTPLAVYRTNDVWHAKIGNDSGQIRFGGQTASGAVIQSRTNTGTARDLYLQRDGGNVGIGTNSPDALLELSKSVVNAQGATLRLTNAVGGAGAGVAVEFAGPGTQPIHAKIITVDAGAYDSNLIFQTKATGTGGALANRLTINNVGKVGIGTSSPGGGKLTVSDGAAGYATTALIQVRKNLANGNDTTSKAGILFANNSNGFEIAYGGTTDRLRILDGGAVERFTILNGGNVGIGETVPTQKLDVNGLVKHKGLDMTAGVQVDQTTSISVSLSGAAGSWHETGIDGTDIGNNGSYVIQVYSNTQGAGASNYSMYWTGTMSWYAFGTNSGNTSEIYLNSAGHYRGMDLELRTISSGNGNNPPSMRINFKSNQTLTGHAVVFKFRRLM